MKIGIYILSKSRAENCLTANIFLSENIDFKIVIEPQDENKYRKRYNRSSLIVMPENNQGIAYARNFCKKYSINQEEDFHWQFDDNIKQFRKRENNKNIKTAAHYCISEIEKEVQKYHNIGIAGMCYSVFAFTKKNNIDINKQIASACLFNNIPNIWWRDNTIEDTDYSMQILTQGLTNRANGKNKEAWCTLLFNRILIDKLRTMTMKGGNTEIEYSTQEKQRIRLHGLQKQWPGIFKEKINKHGIIRAAPSRIWQSFKQQPISIK